MKAIFSLIFLGFFNYVACIKCYKCKDPEPRFIQNSPCAANANSFNLIECDKQCIVEGLIFSYSVDANDELSYHKVVVHRGCDSWYSMENCTKNITQYFEKATKTVRRRTSTCTNNKCNNIDVDFKYLNKSVEICTSYTKPILKENLKTKRNSTNLLSNFTNFSYYPLSSNIPKINDNDEKENILKQVLGKRVKRNSTALQLGKENTSLSQDYQFIKPLNHEHRNLETLKPPDAPVVQKSQQPTQTNPYRKHSYTVTETTEIASKIFPSLPIYAAPVYPQARYGGYRQNEGGVADSGALGDKPEMKQPGAVPFAAGNHIMPSNLIIYIIYFVLLL